MNRTPAATIFFILIVHSRLMAGGFETNLKTVSGAGMAGAQVALSQSSSAAVYNPAAIGLLPKKMMFGAGMAGMLSKTSYFETGTANINSKHPAKFLPSFCATFQINEMIGAGLSYYSSFGYHHRWEDNWPGRFVTIESMLGVKTIQPSVSVTFENMFGISASALISNGKYNHRKALATGNNEGEALLEGKGSSVGFMLGSFLKLNENIAAGVTIKWNGNLKMKNSTLAYSRIPASWQDLYPSAEAFDMTIRLPYCITAGGSITFNQDLVTTAELSYTGWKRLDSLYFSSPVPDGGPAFLRLNNSLSGRLGVQYTFIEEFIMKGGIAYEVSPYNSDHLLPSYPDANKVSFALGAEFKPKPKFSVEVTAGLENVFERKGVDADNFLYGSYNTTRYFFGAGINYHF
jgi:long-chain fatty acid transport protein